MRYSSSQIIFTLWGGVCCSNKSDLIAPSVGMLKERKMEVWLDLLDAFEANEEALIFMMW